MNFNLKNWKTTLGGVFAIIIQGGPIFFPKYISHDMANAISAISVAAGLTQAKDHNVTGGTVLNSVNDASVVKSASKTDEPK